MTQLESSRQFAIRLPSDLVDRLDRMVVRMKQDQPGMNITRADVIRMLVTRCLEQQERDAAAKGKRRRPT